MTDKLTIYNAALLHCGERRLAALTDNVESRRILDAIWDDGLITSMLSDGLWNFATRTLKYTYSPDIEPDFGYRRAFNKPTDWVRTAGMCEDEFFTAPLIQYEDEGGYWFANLDIIYVKFISSDSQFGGDLSLWTDNFTSYVELYVASKAVIRISQSESRKMAIDKDMKKALSDAKSTDAMDQAAKFKPLGSWSVSRLRRFQSSDRGNQNQLIG